MSKITVWFIRMAMIYFVIAVLLGIYMGVHGSGYPYKPIHTHFNLLGWMSMMIFGVAYHILPRFSGQALWSDRAATAQFWLSNIGLLGMTAGWFSMASGGSSAIFTIFAIIEAISIVLFVLNMFLTIKPIAPPKPKPKA